jgi:hypothetical protein
LAHRVADDAGQSAIVVLHRNQDVERRDPPDEGRRAIDRAVINDLRSFSTSVSAAVTSLPSALVLTCVPSTNR